MNLSKNKTLVFTPTPKRDMEAPKNKLDFSLVWGCRKKIILLFFVVFFVFSPAASPAKAWTTVAAFVMHESWLTVTETIKGIQLGAAFNAATIALNSEMEYLLTGKSTGGPLFVTDWRAYAVEAPNNKSNLYAERLITNSLNGKGSLTGYVPKGSEGFGINSSYFGQLDMGARLLLQEPTCKITYQGDPSRMFAGPDPFRQMNLYLGGNTPWDFNACIATQRQKELDANQFIAQLKLTSGILGKEVGGITVNPAGLIEAQVAKVQNLGADILANAKNLPQIISATVSSAINQAMINGIGQLQASVHKEVTNVRTQAINEVNKAIQSAGPAAMYGIAAYNSASSVPGASLNARCQSCLSACSTAYPSGGQQLTDCQTACAPQCGGN